MKLTGPKETIERARALRKAMTKSERLLWWALRRNSTGFRFRRQHPAGPYILDFYCDAVRLCVEIDGESHELQADHDRRRDAWMRKQGVQTLRSAASDVLSNLDGMVATVVEAARNRSDA